MSLACSSIARTRIPLVVAALSAIIVALPLLAIRAPAAERAVVIPQPAIDIADTDTPQTIVLAGGCFWGIQAVFQHTKGVTRAISGYTGGSAATADYDRVSTGRTGHAEAVEITFDPKIVSYGRLLQIFFSVAHNPTHRNRQGADIGTQYRSAIFVRNDDQARVAKAYIKQLDTTKAFPRPIATVVTSLKEFYPAEDVHQDYFTLNPEQPYIIFIDRPKVDNLKKLFANDYRDEPVLVSASATN
jgi:peptide-methionine (S)-S-oxide reductase